MTKVALLINEVQLSPNIPQSSSKIQPECLVPAHTAQAYTGQKRCHRNFAKFSRRRPLLPSVIIFADKNIVRTFAKYRWQLRDGLDEPQLSGLRDSCKLTVWSATNFPLFHDSRPENGGGRARRLHTTLVIWVDTQPALGLVLGAAPSPRSSSRTIC